MKQKSKITCLIVFAGFVVTVPAPELCAIFDTYNTGARPFALGGSFLAISDDAYATNPAGLGQVRENQVCATHNSIYETGDLADNFVSIIINRGAGSARLGARRFGLLGEYFEDIYSLGYGREITDNFNFGFNYKVMSVDAPGYSKTGDNSYKGGTSAVSFDAGFLARATENVKLAAAIFDINSPSFKMLSSSPEGEKAGIEAGIGAAYSILNSMIFSLEYRKNAGEIRAGSEISVNDTLFLRLGTNKNAYTGGLGVKFPLYKGTNMQFDFAFSSHRMLGLSYQTSTILRWE